VAKFEDLGRKLDLELEKLREVAEKKISPATRRKAANSLRTVSDTLARIAKDLDADLEPTGPKED
jgi:hypothetical protein